ncbi:MAG: hypothetical protein KME54_12100 [Tolypothrix brevis GSE-NOS-MK-07-07A]|nr:hypothetical protein [Tolypothrix brevis GSE-NOS-MK-07-07A]
MICYSLRQVNSIIAAMVRSLFLVPFHSELQGRSQLVVRHLLGNSSSFLPKNPGTLPPIPTFA